MRKKVFPLLCFVILHTISLFPVAAVPATVADSEVHSPFAATGLLVRPDESAEEILLRAHQWDARAILLAVAGYSRGIGGFPRDSGLGWAWNAQLLHLGIMDLFHLGSLVLLSDETQPRDFPPGYWVGCAAARKNSLAPAFAKAGILNVEKFCATPTPPPDLKDHIALLQSDVDERTKKAETLRRILRDLHSRPATLQELRLLSEAADVLSYEAVFFYIATTHNPANDMPDWNPERLLAFMDMQREHCLPVNSQKKPLKFVKMIPFASEELVKRVSEAHSDAKELIRSAHGKFSTDENSIKAFRNMARHYRNGSDGFIKDRTLSEAWMRFAALKKDSLSMVLLATSKLAENEPADAWAWATAATGTPGADPETVRMARRIIRMVEEKGDAALLDKAREATARLGEATRADP